MIFKANSYSAYKEWTQVPFSDLLPLQEKDERGGHIFCENSYKGFTLKIWNTDVLMPVVSVLWHRNRTCRLLHFEAFRMLNSRTILGKDSNCGLLRHDASDDLEHDLEAMVLDFIENGSSELSSRPCECDTEGFDSSKDRLQALLAMCSHEREILRFIMSVISSFDEAEIAIWSNGNGIKCNGSCIRRLLVKHLRLKGHDAALRKVKWDEFDNLPGGEYEYIDILLSDPDSGDSLIIDTDFRAQFKIARPVPQYEAFLALIPVIFVGNPKRLEQMLHFMSEAAKSSLKQNSMHVPPWRTLKYMHTKWFSAFTRITRFDDSSLPIRNACKTNITHECREQLQHLKQSLTL